MSRPGQTVSLSDPGMGSVNPGTKIPIVMGTCSSGTAAVVKTYSSIPSLVAAEGYGPAVRDAALILNYCGGPVRFCKIAQSAAGAMGAVTQTGGGPAMTNNSSTPYLPYQLKWVVTKGGALATARAKYSLDNGRQYSEEVLLAATYSITNTGVSCAFAAGTYEVDTTYEAACTAPIYTTTELATAIAAVNASPLTWNFLVLSGTHATAGAANTLAGAVDGYLTTWFGNARFVGAHMDAGSGDTPANILTNFTQTSKRIVPAAGYLDTVIPTPQPGLACPRVPLYVHSAMKADVELMSTNLGRVLSGNLFGSQSASSDFPNPYSIPETNWSDLDDAGICVATTYPFVPGWYLNRGRIKAPFGSDFTEWALLAVMNRALEVTYAQQAMMVNRTFKVTSTGTLDKAEADDAQAKVQSALDVVLKQERNAEGTLGHVSDVFYTIDRTYNTGATGYVQTQLEIVPRIAARNIILSAGFRLNA
jgi:hypothetical protein